MADEATAAERQVSGMAPLTDPGGYVHEIFWGAIFTVGSFLPGKPMKGFVAGSLGVGHVVVAVPQITVELESFATGVPGFTLYAGAPVGMGKAGGPQPQFYRCNSRTHCFAYLGLAGVRGVQHMCLEANDLDDVGRAYDLVQARGLPITLTLGRHSMDRLVSFYMRVPAASTSNSALAASCSVPTSSCKAHRNPKSGATSCSQRVGRRPCADWIPPDRRPAPAPPAEVCPESQYCSASKWTTSRFLTRPSF